jgi:flavodoxin
MKKTLIIYHSSKGTTKKYAEEIGNFLKDKELELKVVSIINFKVELLDNVEYLLLGCWTSGLFFFAQKPEFAWRNFASKLPKNLTSKILLFSTFKILTGSMFKNMQKQLNENLNISFPILKSRNGKLSEKDKAVLNDFFKN